VRRRTVMVATFAAAAVACGASTTPPRVIPWLNERPVKVSAHPPLAPPCAADALRAHLTLQGATGSLVGGVSLLNDGSAPCSLSGWPTVSFTGNAAAATRVKINDLAHTATPIDVLADPLGSLRALARGKSAGVTLWWSNWCGPGATPTGSSGTPPTGIKFSFASGTSLVVPLGQAPRCDQPQSPSLLSVGPFAPAEHHLGASSKLPLKASIVGSRPVLVKTGLRAFRARRGQLFRYEVALTNTGKSTFRFNRSRCPIYIEQLIPGTEEVYLLNCRPVEAIAAGQTVFFAMQLRVSATAPLRDTGLSFELAPRTFSAPFASAAVLIEP
jgi:hypothetical protein